VTTSLLTLVLCVVGYCTGAVDLETAGSTGALSLMFLYHYLRIRKVERVVDAGTAAALSAARASEQLTAAVDHATRILQELRKEKNEEAVHEA
jgi:hypothetical protein